MHKIDDDITNMGGGMNYINCECMTEIKYNTNIIKFEDFVEGYITSAGILFIGDNAEMTSDYTPVTPGKYYKFDYDTSKKTQAKYWCCMSYYNPDKTFIIRYSTGETEAYTQQKTLAPANAKYLRVSARFLVGASWAEVKESDS